VSVQPCRRTASSPKAMNPKRSSAVTATTASRLRMRRSTS